MKKLIAILFLLFLGSTANANKNPGDEQLDTSPDKVRPMPGQEYGGGMYWSHVPVICGMTGVVQEYLSRNDFILENVSVGRKGANQHGEPVYMVSYFLNKDKTQSIAVITSPSGLESCMMFKSFDLKLSGEAT